MARSASPPVDPERPGRRKAGVDPSAAERSEDQTEELGERSVELSQFYGGKIETVPKVPVRSLGDFALWYTPGVAAV